MKIEQMQVADLIPYERNAKKHDDRQVANVAKSIEEFGMVQPIVVDKENNIIIGHCRALACKKAGVDEVPVVRMEDLTPEEANKLRFLDNKLNESEWDFEALKLDGFADIDFDGFDLDFDFESLDTGGGIEVEEDEAPPVPDEPVSKVGDLYILGDHRLICGDSTDPETIKKLMDGQKADMVFTDPPYNLETKGGCKGDIGKSLKKLGSSIEFIADFEPEQFLNVLPSVFNGNMNAYIFCNSKLLPDYLTWAKNNKYSWNVLFWKKPSAIPLNMAHFPDTEYLLFFRKDAIWNYGIDGVTYSKCLEFSRVTKTEENGKHPTIKPVELIANELKISSNKGSTVVDFFGGSGSTLIACEQLERKCYTCELDPRYADVIVQRWENLTGRKAERR